MPKKIELTEDETTILKIRSAVQDFIAGVRITDDAGERLWSLQGGHRKDMIKLAKDLIKEHEESIRRWKKILEEYE